MRNIIRLVFTSSFVLFARADIVEHLDAVALGNIGTGTNDCGWVVENADNYSERYKYALRFLKATSVTSPVFPTPIISVQLNVFSSSQADRRLAVTPVGRIDERPDLACQCDYSPSSYALTTQTVAWSVTNDLRRIHLNLEGTGQTGWGLVSLDVIRASPPPLTIRIR